MTKIINRFIQKKKNLFRPLLTIPFILIIESPIIIESSCFLVLLFEDNMSWSRQQEYENTFSEEYPLKTKDIK